MKMKPELENASRLLLSAAEADVRGAGDQGELCTPFPPSAPPVFGRVQALLGARQAETVSAVRFWAQAGNTVLCVPSLPK